MEMRNLNTKDIQLVCDATFVFDYRKQVAGKYVNTDGIDALISKTKGTGLGENIQHGSISISPTSDVLSNLLDLDTFPPIHH
jgi:hypothetical protein